MITLTRCLSEIFRKFVRDQVDAVFHDLVKRVENALEKVRGDVNYNAQVTAPFEDVIEEERGKFRNRVDGVVVTKASELDALLLFKPKTIFRRFHGNEILAGLEEATRLGFDTR